MGIVVRMVADAIMIAVVLMVGMLIDFNWVVYIDHIISPATLASSFVQAYLFNVWLLVAISLIVFSLSGFYTRGRFYRGRYKALMIVQAVTISYAIFGVMTRAFPDTFVIPDGALLAGWLLTVATIVVARLWLKDWAELVVRDQSNDRSEPTATSGNAPSAPLVLVIGGAGYIGSALLPSLLEKGWRVRLLDLMLFGIEPIKDVIDHPNLEIVRADFRNVDHVVEAMRGVESVIHLGAIVGDPACALDEELTIEVNLMATRMIAEVAKGSGVSRFIFASTCSVYGASDYVLDERSKLNPVSLYARSKIASEHVLMRMATREFSPVILRFGTIYGLSGRTRFDLVINLLTAKALLEEQITVMGGDQWRPFVHVADAARAVGRALEVPLALVHGQVFNVGSNEQNYTIQQVAELIHRLNPAAELIDKGFDGDRRNYRVNFDKIHRQLGFSPTWTVEAGVRQVMQAIQNGHVVDYRDAVYSNVKFLREDPASHQLIHREREWVYQLLNEASTEQVVIEQQPVQLAMEPLKEQAVGN
jgi:nucleoside-diphosphate-sugar epimerase